MPGGSNMPIPSDSIVRCVPLMRRIFSNPITALAAGACLRFFFVLKYPAGSGDTGLIRATRDKLAETPYLWREHQRSRNAGGNSHARLSGVSRGHLLVKRQNWTGCAVLGNDYAGYPRFAYLPGDRRNCCRAGFSGFPERAGAPGIYRGAVAGGALSVHRELHCRDFDGNLGHLLYRGGAALFVPAISEVSRLYFFFGRHPDRYAGEI